MIIRIFLIISLALIIVGFSTPNLWIFQKKCTLNVKNPSNLEIGYDSSYAYGNLGLWKAYYDSISMSDFTVIPSQYTISMTLTKYKGSSPTSIQTKQFNGALQNILSKIVPTLNLLTGIDTIFSNSNSNLNSTSTIMIVTPESPKLIQNSIISKLSKGDFIKLTTWNDFTPDSQLKNIVVKQVKSIVIDNGFDNISTNSDEFAKNFQNVFGFKLLFSNNLFYVMKIFFILSIIAIVTTIVLINKKPKLSAFICLLGFILTLISSIIFSNIVNNSDSAFINQKIFTKTGPDNIQYKFQNYGEGSFNSGTGFGWWFVSFGMVILFVTNMFIFQKSKKNE